MFSHYEMIYTGPMDEPGKSPFRFSLVYLIVYVNLAGLGAVPIVRAGWVWFGAAIGVACLFFVLTITGLTNGRDAQGNLPRKPMSTTVSIAFWVALMVFLYFTLFLYLIPVVRF